MILEIIFVFLIGLVLGITLIKLLDNKLNIANKIKERKFIRSIENVINNPEVLKKRLEENGELIDDGKKVIYDIAENENGKYITVRKEKLNISQKKEIEGFLKQEKKKTPGKPAKSKKVIIKKSPGKKR